MQAQRAVVDTNVLVSGLLRRDGSPGQIVDAIRDGSLVPVFTAAVLEEYTEVLHRPRLRIEPAVARELIDGIRSFGEHVEPSTGEAPADLPDIDDWPFAACALAAQVPLVTGNLRHLPPELGVQVMSARQWCDARRGV